MEIKFNNNTIEMNKELNIIDKFTIDMMGILNRYFDYVIVSGYLSILFGKPRGTEDIDAFIKKVSIQEFESFYKEITERGYEIMNSVSMENSFSLLENNVAIRIARKGTIAPNLELKFPKDKWGNRALEKKIKVILNNNNIFISSIEMNIAYKIYMGSRKDIDDACHLYLLFKKLNHLDKNRIVEMCSELGTDPKILESCENG